jgi:thymidylate synthase (FAD)
MTASIGTRVDVLDRGWVELQDLMGDDLAIVNAARTSFLGESKGDERDKKLLFYLMRHRHDSPFEMVSFRFRIHAPEVVWRQLLRHRTGKFNLQSYRYMEAEEEEFYVPQVWRLQSQDNKQASEGTLDAESSAALTEALTQHYEASFQLYKDALEKGVAREIARMFLPGFALYSTGIVKFDARNLMHFLSLRMAEDAQYEIRQFANAMWEFFEAALPWCAEAYQEYRQSIS